MVNNTRYRKALKQFIPDILIKDGRILVTGATGLIGSCLIDLLMLANENGRTFEIYALGRSKEKLRKRFISFKDSQRLHFIEQDVRTPLKDNIHYDYIVHGASNADPRNYALYPVETMLTTMEGTINVLRYGKAHPTSKILLLSSFEVYGNAGKDVYFEKDGGTLDLNAIRSCYPESKRCVEILSRCYVDEYEVDVTIGRLCSIYGPTMGKNDSKAHAQFVRNALRNEDIILKSKGEQRRTYCYVMDAVTALLCLLSKGLPGEAYNISYDQSVASIAEVAQTVAEIVGTKVVFSLPDEVETRGFSKPQNCILNNEKLRSLGWKGCYALKEGLKETIDILSQQ